VVAEFELVWYLDFSILALKQDAKALYKREARPPVGRRERTVHRLE
jgi:hypothetical protein